jgi:hypothetical protein
MDNIQKHNICTVLLMHYRDQKLNFIYIISSFIIWTFHQIILQRSNQIGLNWRKCSIHGVNDKCIDGKLKRSKSFMEHKGSLPRSNQSPTGPSSKLNEYRSTSGSALSYTKPRYMDGIIREVTEIELQPNNMDRWRGFCLSKSWKPFTYSLKDRSKPPSRDSRSEFSAGPRRSVPTALILPSPGTHQPPA